MSDKRKQGRESKTVDFSEKERRIQKTPDSISNTHPPPPKPKPVDKPSKKD